jgi:hypothetical protein
MMPMLAIKWPIWGQYIDLAAEIDCNVSIGRVGSSGSVMVAGDEERWSGEKA